jgi:K+ transporter
MARPELHIIRAISSRSNFIHFQFVFQLHVDLSVLLVGNPWIKNRRTLVTRPQKGDISLPNFASRTQKTEAIAIFSGDSFLAGNCESIPQYLVKIVLNR